MLDYNEILPRKFVIFEDEPYEVLDSHVFRKQQRKPINAVKMRNMLTGRVLEKSFQATDKVDLADIVYSNVKFLYQNKGEWWFCDEKNASNRFKISTNLLENAVKYLKTDMIVEAMNYEEQVIGIKIPIKVELKVTEAPPAVRGDTARGGNKVVTLENGTTITAPMFISEGDVIRINTESGEYVERA